MLWAVKACVSAFFGSKLLHRDLFTNMTYDVFRVKFSLFDFSPRIRVKEVWVGSFKLAFRVSNCYWSVQIQKFSKLNLCRSQDSEVKIEKKSKNEKMKNDVISLDLLLLEVLCTNFAELRCCEVISFWRIETWHNSFKQYLE